MAITTLTAGVRLTSWSLSLNRDTDLYDYQATAEVINGFDLTPISAGMRDVEVADVGTETIHNALIVSINDVAADYL